VQTICQAAKTSSRTRAGPRQKMEPLRAGRRRQSGQKQEFAHVKWVHAGVGETSAEGRVQSQEYSVESGIGAEPPGQCGPERRRVLVAQGVIARVIAGGPKPPMPPSFLSGAPWSSVSHRTGSGNRNGALRKLTGRKSPERISAFSRIPLSVVATKIIAPDARTFSISRQMSAKER